MVGRTDEEVMIAEVTRHGETIKLGDTVPHLDATIRHAIWRYVIDAEGKQTGRCVRVAGRPIPEVVGELTRKLEAEDLIDEYFGCCTEYRMNVEGSVPVTWDRYPKDWPDGYRWIACYAVTGGSEGHYIHVDIIAERERAWWRIPIALGKTFQGMEHAQKIAARCAELLGA